MQVSLGPGVHCPYWKLGPVSGGGSYPWKPSLPQAATHKSFDLVNYNRLVIPGNQYTYPGATGMKTAFTDNAGPCMVATASRDGRLLVAVVMNSDNFFADAIKLLDYGYSQSV